MLPNYAELKTISALIMEKSSMQSRFSFKHQVTIVTMVAAKTHYNACI